MTSTHQLVVVLDAGHGGSHKIGGSSPNNAVGPNGALEKDLTLDIARRTATALAGHAQVVLTRATDTNLSLADRAAAARANQADVFLSIHLNGAHEPSIDGTEVWVARAAGPESVALGQVVLEQLVAVTQVRNRGVRRADFGVLLPQRHAPGTAACLAEIAFLTNPAEARRLADDGFKNQLAQALATAVLSRAQVLVPAGGGPAQTHGLNVTAFPTRLSPVATSAAIIDPEIDYSATSLEDANRIWQDWLARYGQWRKGVPDASLTRFPHVAICQLKLYDDARGRLAYGTGFYIGNETLLTCGHNFLDGSWQTSRVEVQPGHSPRASTLATQTFSVVARDVVHPRWRDAADSTHDLAVLRVPGLAATAGTFALANRSLGADEGIVVCGYGKVDGEDFDSQGQRMDGAHIAEADTEMVYYPIQTIGGHSGSPVFHQGTVIGVHTGPRTGNSQHQNRAVLLNPEKIDWINRQAGTSLGLSLGTGAPRPASALADENSSQAEQSLEVRRHIAHSLGQAETGNRFDLISMDSNRVNFGIGSWTGAEISELLDVYVQVAGEIGGTQAMLNIFGGQAGFDALRNRFRTQGAAATISPAERTALQQLGADASLQEAQVRKLADDVRVYLGAIGSDGHPWYPYIDGGMGAISELAAHVLVHARHQSGAAGLRHILQAAIDAFGGAEALGRMMVAGTAPEIDFLGQVGEEVARRVQPQYQQGVRNRYATLRANYSRSRLAYYFNPAATPAPTTTHGLSLAAGIGGIGAADLRSGALEAVTLGYGVPGGVITDGFYRDETERQAITGRSYGRRQHLGIDVSTSNAHGGGADDPRRGLPVYAVIKRSIPISELKAVRATNNGVSASGLEIDGQGNAELSNAVVLAQPWGDHGDSAYGGVVGLACRYAYAKTDGSRGTLTLYIEFLHLITPAYLPKAGDGQLITAEAWAATGRGIGFGPRIRNGAQLTANDLCGGDPILVGHLGATQFPHVHIQAAFAAGEHGYLRQPRLDPALVLQQTATTTQALAFGSLMPGLAMNGPTVMYDVPGTVEPLAQPKPMACWAAAATMLISWRDQASYSIPSVCDTAGANYRSLFETDAGLSQADKPGFLARLGLREEPPANYSLQAYLEMMRRFGPLWVTTDVGSSGHVAIHGRIMTGAYGDGTPAGTNLWLIDPADGQRHHETFEHFVQTFEQIARDVGAADPLLIQVVHNPGR